MNTYVALGALSYGTSFFLFLELFKPDEQSAGEPSTKKPRSQFGTFDSVATSCELKEINESKLIETRWPRRYTCD